MMGDEPLYHYSSTLVTFERRYYEQNAHFKPNGFWLSVGDDWKRWCEENNFSLANLAYRHRVVLCPGANILRLSGPREIDRFTKEYDRGLMRIDWPLVARRYAGIIIAPYCWSRRCHFGTRWYYAWDCASGCIWDPSAVDSLNGP